MRTLNREDIEALAHGETIPRFVARIKKVWDQNSGEGEYGTWFLQNLQVVVEGDDKELTVTWTGADEFEENWRGRTVAFECTENKKGRLVGVCRDIRTGKDGRIFKGVKITPMCKVKTLDHNGAAASDDAPPPTKAAPEPPESRPRAEEPPPPSKAKPTSAEPQPKPVAGTPSSSLDDELELYARNAQHVFSVAWEHAAEVMEVILPEKKADAMDVAEIYDLHLRIAQGFAIEINKTIRRERF